MGFFSLNPLKHHKAQFKLHTKVHKRELNPFGGGGGGNGNNSNATGTGNATGNAANNANPEAPRGPRGPRPVVAGERLGNRGPRGQTGTSRRYAEGGKAAAPVKPKPKSKK